MQHLPTDQRAENQMAAHVVNILKTMFSKYGILAHVFTDQGRHFTWPKFWEFAKCYRFKVLHSTPRYQQSNGFIESMVRVVKQIMSKADQAREDAHQVMVAYRSSPKGPGKLSPSEAMTQHKFRALLLVKQHLSTWTDESKDTMIQQK